MLGSVSAYPLVQGAPPPLAPPPPPPCARPTVLQMHSPVACEGDKVGEHAGAAVLPSAGEA